MISVAEPIHSSVRLQSVVATLISLSTDITAGTNINYLCSIPSVGSCHSDGLLSEREDVLLNYESKQ